MNPWLYIPAALMSAGFAYKVTLVIRLLLGRTSHLEAVQNLEEEPKGKPEKKSAAA